MRKPHPKITGTDAANDPQTLAKHAIEVLEQRIRSDFGIRVNFGAELEFTLAPRDENAALDLDHPPVQYPPEYKKFTLLPENWLFRFTPTQETPRRNQFVFAPYNADTTKTIAVTTTDPFFPQDPHVCYSYDEEKKFQYEIVFSHEAADAQGNPQSALSFAQSIEEKRAALANMNADKCPDAKHRAALLLLAKHWRSVFDGVYESKALEERTQGLHININFTTDNGKPLPARFYREQGKELLNGLGGTMAEGNYLLLPDDAATKRLAIRSHHTEAVYLQPKERYLELRSPAANSDPYYATMLALAGIYYTLKQGKYNAETQQLEDSYALLCRYDLSAKWNLNAENRFFASERRVLSTLNEVEAGLGDLFEQAVQKNPPGHSISSSAERGAAL